MTITIDRAGRVVIPKEIRDRYNLHAGSVLEIELEADAVRLCVVGQQPSLVRKDGILVHHGSATVDLDVAAIVNRDREHRDRSLVAERPNH
jgi:AbrB family looped-hinge helix DNA binding protein